MKNPFNARTLLCEDCDNFDKPSQDFSSSNLCRCRVDGRKHWAGDYAGDCDEFVIPLDSYVGAFYGG